MSDPSQPVPTVSPDRVRELLTRPIEQRRMEFRYRFAQAMIFGLPVLGLQFFGHHLSAVPGESDRWVGILQALLTGWVTYVAAAGMLAEGVLTIRHGVTGDLIVSAVVVPLYLICAISVLGVFVKGHPFFQPLFFHWIVLLLAGWCGYRWRRLASV